MKIAEKLYISDEKILHVINNKIKCGFLDTIMPYVSKLGGAIFVALLPITLMILGEGKIRLIGAEIFESLFISHLVVRIIKRTFMRVRPYDALEQVYIFGNKLRDYSFPSGHTTASFSIATIVILNVSYLMMPMILFASLVGVSRIYIGVHYPSDVIVGAVLGTVTSMITYTMF